MRIPSHYRNWIILVICASFVLAACGGTPQAAPTTAPTEPPAAATETPTAEAPTATPVPAVVTLKLATWSNETEAASLQKVLDTVNAQAQGYQIELQTYSVGYQDLLKQALDSETPPDIFWLKQEVIPSMVKDGKLMDITAYLQSDTTHGAAKIADYFPEAIKTDSYDQKYYALPWTVQPVVLYFNQALFDKAGLAYPDQTWDWTRFQNSAQMMSIDEDRDGKKDQWGFVMNGWPPVAMYVWQAGGELISDDLQSCPIDSAETVKGITYFAQMMYSDTYSPTVATFQNQNYDQLIAAGKIGMWIGYAGDHYTLPEGMTLGMTSVPVGPATNDTYADVYSIAINKHTANQDLAYQAMIALTEALQTWKVASPRQSQATAGIISQADPEKAAYADLIASILPTIRTQNIIPRQSEWKTAFFSNVIDKSLDDPQAATINILVRQDREDLEQLLPRD